MASPGGRGTQRVDFTAGAFLSDEGIVFGNSPIGAMRSTLPIRLSVCCGCIQSSDLMPRPAGTVVSMSSVPSFA
jgi:hypothetical protein